MALKKPPENCPNGEACVELLDEKSKHFHLDRSISIGHIITTIVAVGTFFAWALKQESRMTALEQHAIQSASNDKQQKDEISAQTAALARRLDRIEDKLDRVITKRLVP